MVTIRRFVDSDCDHLVEILRLNEQFADPEVEDQEAMRRFANSDTAVFLVSESDGVVNGLIRATHDGSRAMIHLLSVNPSMQRRGIGGALVRAAEKELRRLGAPSVSVTVTESNEAFWERHEYVSLPVRLMLKRRFSDGT